MKSAGCDNDVVGVDEPPVRLEAEAPARSVTYRQAAYARAQLNGCGNDLGVPTDSVDDLVAPHETVRFGPVVGESRQGCHPVRGHKTEFVPAVLPTATESLAPLEEEMLAPAWLRNELITSPAWPAPTTTVSTCRGRPPLPICPSNSSNALRHDTRDMSERTHPRHPAPSARGRHAADPRDVGAGLIDANLGRRIGRRLVGKTEDPPPDARSRYELP
jgi:hypothetical protein